MITKNDLTIIYYTANYLDNQNPVFLKNTEKQLVKAIGDLPLIVVSHKPVERFDGYTGEFTNIVAGKDYELYREGRYHLNIYKQILEGSKVAKTPFVAMAEDDILYSFEHFHSPELEKMMQTSFDKHIYDMNKVSLFTWTKIPMFSFRTKRRVVNHLVSPTKMLVESMEERFARVEELKSQGRSEESIIKYFGDPSRYENLLGVTPREAVEYYSDNPSIVLSHPKAYGYEFNQGKRKRLGDLKIIELYGWGRADKMLEEIWGNYPRE